MSQDPSKVWLITGSSSGLGMRLVISVLARGDRVIASARSREKLDNFISSLNIEDKDRVRSLQLDVTDGEEKIKSQIDQAAAFWGRIDVLVNNAGLTFSLSSDLARLKLKLDSEGHRLPGLMEEGGTKLLRLQFETNVFGVLDVSDATLPYLRQSKTGCLVVIGSRSARKPEIPGIGHYAASKAAIHAVTEAFMTELAQFNIKVLLVEPGGFRTEGKYDQLYFTQNLIPAYDTMRNASQARYASAPGSERGDPCKAVEAIVDVVNGEGVAKGRPWPGYLALGDDAELDIKAKCSKVLAVLDEWADVTRGVSFDT